MVHTRVCKNCETTFDVGKDTMLYFEYWERCPKCWSLSTERRRD